MTKSPRATMCGFRLALWWVWGLLVPLLIACPQPPQELVCVPTGIFEVLEPERGVGAAPFSVERLGAEMKGALDKPESITFIRGGTRAIITWRSYGHMYSESEVVYSPSEGLARSPKDPTEVYPISFVDGKAHRMRLGYDSKVCRKPDANGGYTFCKYSEARVPLVADMTCRRQRAQFPEPRRTPPRPRPFGRPPPRG